MPSDVRDNIRRLNRYSQQTLSPLNCLVFVLPLLVFFHLGTAIYGTRLLAPHLIGRMLNYLGVTQWHLSGLLILAVLLLQHAAQNLPWKVQPRAIAGMIGESIAFTIPLIAMSYVTGRFSMVWGQSWAEPLLSVVGAGVYEEFLFRLVLLNLALLVFTDVFGLKKDGVLTFFIIAGGMLFSLCHFSGEELTGRALFSWSKFIFLGTAGILWGALYAFRGFAVAVGSHIAWDLYVVAMHHH